MKLHNIPTIPGSTKRAKRLGAGVGSGRGKTCGKGHKGQKARAGCVIRIGFEGGQMPLFRRMPHRGFNNYRFRTEYAVVNLSALQQLEASEIDRAVLEAAGVIRKDGLPLKVLGTGDIKKAVTVKADKFSASAKSKIEAAGGKVVVLQPLAAKPE